MNKEFFRSLIILERVKGIPRDYMTEKVCKAIESNIKKETGAQEIKVVLDFEKFEMKIAKVLTVIDIEQEEAKAKEEFEKREEERREEERLKALAEEQERAELEKRMEGLSDEERAKLEAELEVERKKLEEEKKKEEDQKRRAEEKNRFSPVYDDDGNLVVVYDKQNGAEKRERTTYFKYNPNQHITVEEAKSKSKKKYKPGDKFEEKIDPREFSRVVAHNTKQMITQAIREKEQEQMVVDFESKREEIVTGIVTSINAEHGDAIVEIGRHSVRLNSKDQIKGETLKVGTQVKVYVVDVLKPDAQADAEPAPEKEGEKGKKPRKGPAVSISRAHPGFVKRLFELEVPEIRDGLVEIKSIAREAGSRTKIAVESRDPNVDPIGSCIGAKGIRKNNISRELADEKIDIVKYSADPEEFIKASLAPAQIDEVILSDDGTKACTVLVDDDQLSLAIGKRGQNARLVAKLTGYKIDIKSIADAKRAALEDLVAGRAEATTSFGEAFVQAFASKQAGAAEEEPDEAEETAENVEE